MDKKIDSLLDWLRSSGQFYLDDNVGIIDTKEAGRGVFLKNDHRMKQDSKVVSVPSSYQLNFHTVLYHISKFNKNIRIPGVTVDDHNNHKDLPADDPRYLAYNVFTLDQLLSLTSFQLLIIFILAEWFLLPQWSSGNRDSFWKPFFDVWPNEFELGSIPAVWNCLKDTDGTKTKKLYHELIESLPVSTYDNMLRITALVDADWAVISSILEKWNSMFPEKTTMPIDMQYKKFLLVYFIINSRCLYCEIPLKRDSEDIVESSFTLVPYVDFLNHSDELDEYCYPETDDMKKLAYGIGEFSLKVGPHEYSKKHEQLLLNYGAHSNEFLLSEYGFVMSNNKQDYINITNAIEKLIDGNDEIKRFLQKYDYWGDYAITLQEISFRTLVAINIIATKDFRRVEKFILGYISEDFFKTANRNVLNELLNMLYSLYNEKLGDLSRLASEYKENRSQLWYIENIATIYRNYIDIINVHLRENQINK